MLQYNRNGVATELENGQGSRKARLMSVQPSIEMGIQVKDFEQVVKTKLRKPRTTRTPLWRNFKGKSGSFTFMEIIPHLILKYGVGTTFWQYNLNRHKRTESSQNSYK